MASPHPYNSSSNLGSSSSQDSLNQNQSLGLVSLPVTATTTTTTTTTIYQPVVLQLIGHEYRTSCNPHPKQGKEIFNSTPQGENQSIGSHNSSGWSSGFTARIQDSPLVQDGPRASLQG